MTATDELRRLLDERGVEYGIEDESAVVTTMWTTQNGGWAYDCNYTEFPREKPGTVGAIPELMIYGYTPEQAIAATLGKQFGGFERVIIDVDGEQHEFRADSLIRLLEGYEGAHGTRWHELFSTPERAARTLYEAEGWTCPECPIRNQCKSDWPHDPCPTNDYDSLLEWLRGDA